MKTLIAADKQTSDTIGRLLLQEGFVVEKASDGEEALELTLNGDYEIIVLSANAPEIDGIAICQTLRARGIETPVLVLAEKGHEDNGIKALNAGADEYICKPVIYADLMARIRAILRRPSAASRVPRLHVGDLELDPATKQVRRGSRQIRLTRHEFSLLEYLMRNPGKVMTRAMLEEHVWGTESGIESNEIDSYIRRLRRKIGDKDIIQTIRGFGYRMIPK